MSHRATDWAFEQKLPALQKLVLLALADRHNKDTNRCDPSMDRVADDCGMSRDSVKRAIKALCDGGWIEAHQRKDGPVNLTNYYTFNIGGVGANSTQGRGCQHPGVGAVSTTNQEEEPVIEPVETYTLPGVLDGLAEVSAEEQKQDTPQDRVRRVFTYYLEQTGRRPKMYELTDKRMKVGLSRLRDCQRKCDGDTDKAEQLMGVVVDALIASEFHNGKNDQHKVYNDWIDHLFKSTEKLEWWLERE